MASEAAAEQGEIGWRATLEGRISTKWTDLQEMHYRHTKPRQRATAWAPHTVRLPWEFTHTTWTNRCTVSKDSEREEEQATTQAAINGQTRHPRNNCDPQEHGADDRCLFEAQSVDQLTTKPLHEKQTWLQAASWASESQAEAVHSETTQMRSTLRQWLQTTWV